MRIYVDRDIVSKWEPVIGKIFKYKNRYIIDVICQFCEWYSKKELTGSSDDLTLPDRLNDLVEKINSIKRDNVVGQAYNPITGVVELKLESGKYVSPDGSTYFELSVDELVDMFGVDFVSFLNKEEFRNYQINNIMKDI